MSSSFSFPRPTTTTDDLENLYKAYGVERAVVLDLAGATETPETVRGGYCGAYLSFFHSCGLTFPIPKLVLEILAELGLSFTQVLLNFLRHLIAFSVRAREEGLSFGVGEFRHLVMVQRITQSPGTFLVSPRPDRHIIEDVPYRDEKWREHPFRKFFDVRRDAWSDRSPSERSFGLDEAEHSQEVIATHSVRAQTSDRLTRQLVRRSSFRTSGSVSKNRASGKSTLISIHDSDDEGASEERRSPVSLSPGSGDETVAATRKRRRSSKDTLPGPSRPRFVLEGDGSLFVAQGDLISLAGRMRSAGCRLPSLASLAEKEAYAIVAVTSFGKSLRGTYSPVSVSYQLMEAFNEYVVMMEDHVVASRNDKEIENIGSEIKRLSGELEAAKREGKEDAEKIEALTEDLRRIHRCSSSWLIVESVNTLFCPRSSSSLPSSRLGLHQERRPPVSLSPGSGDETDAKSRKRRRSSKGTLPGPSHPWFVAEGDGSFFASQGDLISLAGRMRSAGCRLPSLASSAEKKAYAKVAVASSKVMEAFNEYVVVMEDHVVACRNDKEIESISSEIKRLSEELKATKREGKKDAEKIEPLTEDWRRIHQENEALTTQVVAQKAKVAALEVERDQDIRRASRIARRDIEQRYREILESLKDKWTSKKKEVSAEIQLQEVTTNIDLLNELKDGGVTVDAELARLKEMERDCEDLVASAAVPDWSISELDLPQISEDSVVEIRRGL
ncbi:hypothetical protein DY000_02058491 [Brassica cretica]|uniref:Uncharacterized protein n=1 Tax=Brassica cretica TaxID=69181 RepID=A0ABQ7AYX2_BRACR|nr:hypothetical protein DY000_02058491 [Brassica cretica]